ncbi:MAG: branched-chain amino acid ABC transporter permease [Thaumarchaeota archaeon]|nr:branched-chain amino acid ABC transporter permease [Nitrososphaerota archaeon]MDG6908710.1 branched-chain amino acid ABC transporter permease [Nitrososphaerota archaeon]
MSFGIENVLQSLVTGVLEGGFFALAAVGLSLIFGVQRILNVAHGSLIVLAAFFTIQFSIVITPSLGFDPLSSIGIDFFALAILGAVIYFAMIYKIENTGFEAPLLATFGLSILIQYLIPNGLNILGVQLIPRLQPSGSISSIVQNQSYSQTSLHIGGIILADPQLIAFLIAIVAIPLVHLFLSRTYTGKSIRATAQDWQAAEFSGIDVRRTRLVSFVLGTALAGLAGGIYAFTTPVSPTDGNTTLLSIILAVIILGGVGNILGTLIGGLVVGIIVSVGNFIALEVLSHFQFPGDFGSLIAFIVFLIVLMVRPTGLFGVTLRK